MDTNTDTNFENGAWNFFSPERKAVKQVRKGELSLYQAENWMRSNRDIVMAAVEFNGVDLALASDELKDDKEIVLEAIFSCPLAIEYASERLRGDRDIVMAAVKRWGDVLEYASDELREDKRVVMMAVLKSPKAIKFALGNVVNDKDVIAAFHITQAHQTLLEEQLRLDFFRNE